MGFIRKSESEQAEIYNGKGCPTYFFDKFACEGQLYFSLLIYIYYSKFYFFFIFFEGSKFYLREMLDCTLISPIFYHCLRGPICER